LIRVARRLQRLEERAAMARKDQSITINIVAVHPEKGATRVLVMETGKPNIERPPTPEEIERVRANMERRRAKHLAPPSADRMEYP
jgi:hypothetical protein